MKTTNLMLSIIIPTYNEEKWLPLLLESIGEQDFKDYEIIVADANSSDKTIAIAKDFGCQIVIGGTPGVGRNSGAKIAAGKYLLFLDADVILPNKFLTMVLRETIEHMADIATCLICPLSQKNFDHFLHTATNYYITIIQKIYPHAPGFCILVKKDIHNNIGGFNENLKLAEDHEYVKRVSKIAKFKILRSKKILVSVRRLEKEGRIKLATKYIFVDLYRLIKGEIDTNIIDYQFGHDFCIQNNISLYKHIKSLYQTGSLAK